MYIMHAYLNVVCSSFECPLVHIINYDKCNYNFILRSLFTQCNYFFCRKNEKMRITENYSAQGTEHNHAEAKN